MSRKKRRNGYRGHFCWCCGRIRANEKFSGKGHSRHLCRDCARLGAEELAYRQALRNLQRCIDYCGLIRRKRRREFNQFLGHDNPRVRAFAQVLLAEDARLRAEQRELHERESKLEEQFYEPELLAFDVSQQESAIADFCQSGSDCIEIPF